MGIIINHDTRIPPKKQPGFNGTYPSFFFVAQMVILQESKLIILSHSDWVNYQTITIYIYIQYFCWYIYIYIYNIVYIYIYMSQHNQTLKYCLNSISISKSFVKHLKMFKTFFVASSKTINVFPFNPSLLTTSLIKKKVSERKQKKQLKNAWLHPRKRQQGRKEAEKRWTLKSW